MSGNHLSNNRYNISQTHKTRGLIAAMAAGAALSLTGCVVGSPNPTVSASTEAPSPSGTPTPSSRTEITVLHPVNNSPEVVDRCNRPADAKVLITIDDFGNSSQVRKYLDALAVNNMKAAIFPVGEWAEDNLDLINQIKAEGHIVGNHTYTHTRLGDLALKNEGKFYGEIYPLAGVANTVPMLLRPPYGDGMDNPRVAEMLSEKNTQMCGWTADSRDWDGSTVDEIMNRLTEGDEYSEPLTAGGLALFHFQSPYGAQALTPLAKHLNENNIPYEKLHD